MHLKHSALRGIQWTGLAQVTRQLVQFGSLAILAALLSPDDFGLLAMAVVVTGFMELFKDLGTRIAIIQKQDPSEAFLSSIFWVNVAIGVLSCGLLLALAGPVAQFYREPRLVPVLQMMALGFPVSGLGASVKAYLEKEIAFDRVGMIETAAAVASALIAIGMAAAGYGVWGLVAQTLSLTALNTLLSWFASSWRPTFTFRWSAIRSVVGYSLNYSGYMILNYMARNVDYLLIGRYLGKESLGYYTLAYRIMLYPVHNINGVLNRVMFPVLSKIQQDNARLASAYLQIAGSFSLVIFQLMLGLLALAEPFVLSILGAQWEPMIPILMILAPTGMTQSVTSAVSPLYLVKEKTGWLFGWGFFSSAVLIAGFVVGLQWGVPGIAWAFLIVSVMLFYPSLLLPLRFIELRPARLLAVLARPLMCSGAMLGALLLALRLLPAASLDRLWVFAALVLFGVLVYAGATLLLNRGQVEALIRLIRERG